MVKNCWRILARIIAVIDLIISCTGLLCLVYVALMVILRKVTLFGDFFGPKDLKSKIIYAVFGINVIVLWVMYLIAAAVLFKSTGSAATAEESLKRSIFWCVVNVVISIVAVPCIWIAFQGHVIPYCLLLRSIFHAIICIFRHECWKEVNAMPLETIQS